MMWNYITLADETQLAYSDLREDGTIVVVAERPVDMGFDSARCIIPSYRWSEVEGFSESELRELDTLVRNNAPLIFELAERRREENPYGMKKPEPWDVTEFLETREDIAEYVKAALEDGDQAIVNAVLGDVARVKSAAQPS